MKLPLMLSVLAASLVLPLASQTAPATAPEIAVYQQLRAPSGFAKAFAVRDLTITRDIGSFTFKRGTICLAQPVEGQTTAAVFTGEGVFTLKPQAPAERRQLAILTKGGDGSQMSDEFEKLVLRFTDNKLPKELHDADASVADVASCNRPALDDVAKKLRDDYHYNLAARMTQDVLSHDPQGLFWAFIWGKNYGHESLFAIDPRGLSVFNMQPEEVAYVINDYNREGVWYSGHLLSEAGTGLDNGAQRNAIHVNSKQKLDTRIERSGQLDGKSETTVEITVAEARLLPFNLFGHLRVSKVADADGKPLSFIQEDKKDDPDFWVVLGKPAHKGDSVTLHIEYSGKDAVRKSGNGNYYPVARDNWYPNTFFGDYATYEMTFRTPKGMTMLATGKKLSEKNEGGETVTTWQSESPLAVAGFNFGDFAVKQQTFKNGFTVSAYANRELPDFLSAVKNDTIFASMSTTSMLDKALSEAVASMQLYDYYFGPLSEHSLAISQQAALGYGQSWPGVVYMPIDYFFDDTQLHFLMGQHMVNSYALTAFEKTVEPHEIAHQWWGHAVGFSNYREQWMSEGFAEFGASLFVQKFRSQKDYLKFWIDRHKELTDKNANGFRAVDVGPLVMGYRLNTGRAGGNITRELIYPKGAFVMHMLRQLMWDNRTGDQNFIETMRSFIKEHQNQPVSAMDFQRAVEQHMTSGMDVDGNGKMDWFFQQWVEGVELPDYSFKSGLTRDAQGNNLLTFTLQQTKAGDDFRMPVGIYVERADGQIIKIGTLKVKGRAVIERTLNLGGGPAPKRAILNYNHDVLTDHME